MVGYIKTSQDILGYLGLGILGLGTGCRYGWDTSRYPRTSWDILDLGYWDSVQAAGMAGIHQDIPGYPGISWTWDTKMAGYIKTSQDILGYRYPGISWTLDCRTPYRWPKINGWGMSGYLRLGIIGLGAGSQNAWDMSGYLRNSA